MGSIQMPGRNGQQAASAHTIIRGQSKREWAEKSRTSWRSGQEREVCHCRTRKAPPTNPVPHLWQVEFLPVNISSPFIRPFVGGWAHHSQPSVWGKIQTEWGDSTKTPSCLASSEPTTSPLATVCGLAPFVQEERKILEDWPESTQVRPGGLSLVLQRDWAPLYELIPLVPNLCLASPPLLPCSSI